MSELLINEVCYDLRNWINHSKEGHRRKEEDLIYFDKLWAWAANTICYLEKKTDSHNKEKNDFLNLVRFEGTLYRVHKKYNRKAEHFGVNETNHYVSWTKACDVTDIYWLCDDMDFIAITANANSKLFGIDLIGLNNYIKKYYYPDYSIGSPAIIKEQEVVFPLKYSFIQNIKINRL